MDTKESGQALGRRSTWAIFAALTILTFTGRAEAVEKASQQVVPFYGSFAQSIPIETAAFHGLEPRLALGYSSEGRNGFVGVGWSLTGLSTIERANSGRGTPRFDASDIYLLDGQELVACVPGGVSPSCTTGGTHSTKIESYLKIRFDSPSNTWTIWGKDGTRTIYSPTVQLPAGTFRWGQTSVVDTKNNTVNHVWNCTGGDCYPGRIDYNGYRVAFFLEARPDTLSAAAYSQLTQTLYRIRSIIVSLPSVGNIRAYKLSYNASPLTGRSLLVSSQQYGKDVVADASGVITGGSSLPAVTFAYQNDLVGKTFQGEAADPPTPPGTVQAVSWTNRINAYAAGAGNSLQKTLNTPAWDAGATSTRAIVSGDGYVEYTAQAGPADQVVGLSPADNAANVNAINFGIWNGSGNGTVGYVLAWENGTYYAQQTVVAGDKLRVEVQGGVVRYKINGTTFYTHIGAPTYPLRVDASISGPQGVINNVFISGALQDVENWCGPSSSHVFLTGDFNGDGRTDQLCYTSDSYAVDSGKILVRLGTATGFADPVTWLTNLVMGQVVVADFNGDGKADIVDGPDYNGNFKVLISTGSAFLPPAVWGTANPVFGTDPNGVTISGACRGLNPSGVTGTGDFNGDGIPDIWCKMPGDGKIYVGLSNGSSFTFTIFANLGCDAYEVNGAIDFDGDGKDDWYCIGMTNNSLRVFPSTGSSFVWTSWGSLDSTFCSYPYYVLGDFNGDGRTDAACLSTGGVALSTGHSFQVQGNPSGGWC